MGKSALHRAVVHGNVYEVRRLLAKYPDAISPNKCKDFDPKKRTLSILHAAVTAKRVQIVELLITREPRLIPVLGFKNGETALHMAAEAGSVEIVQLLIAKEPGAARACCVDYGQTPLHWAIRAGKERVVGVLLKHDVRLIDAVDMMKQNVFHLAAAAQHGLRVMKVLMKYCSRSKLNELITAITTEDHSSQAYYFGHDPLPKRKFISANNQHTGTVLHKAIQNQKINLGLIELLLKLYPGAASVLDSHSRYPLHLALEIHADKRRTKEPSDLVAIKALMQKMYLDDFNFSSLGGRKTVLEHLEEVVRKPSMASMCAVLPKDPMGIVLEYLEYAVPAVSFWTFQLPPGGRRVNKGDVTWVCFDWNKPWFQPPPSPELTEKLVSRTCEILKSFVESVEKRKLEVTE